MIDTCRQIALTRIRKPKRSASYKQQQNYKKIVEYVEKINADNFIDVFEQIESSLCDWDKEKDTYASVKYDIAHGEQIKSWLSLQKTHKVREQDFETKTKQEIRSDKNCTTAIEQDLHMLKQQQELEESAAIAAEKERREKITTKKKEYNAERQAHWNSHAARLNELNESKNNESKNNESKNNESKEESPSELRLVF